VPGAPDTTPTDAVAGERAGRPEPKHPADKVRIRFRKSGALRLLSHHDLMRTFERLLRRSELPFHRSQGFHPKPRLIFALSLPLGVVGCQEVVELELGQVLPLEDIHDRLARQAPPGLEILSVRRIPLKINAQVCRLAYALPVPAERLPSLTSRIAEVLSARECWIDRHRPHSRQAGRRLDVRPFLEALKIVDRESWIGNRENKDPRSTIHDPRFTLEMVLRLTSAGTARPEEVLSLLGLEDLLDAGVVFERSRLELHDELPALEVGAGNELEKGSHEKRDAD
jgi:radical SAM-linked protein